MFPEKFNRQDISDTNQVTRSTASYHSHLSVHQSNIMKTFELVQFSNSTFSYFINEKKHEGMNPCGWTACTMLWMVAFKEEEVVAFDL